MNFDDKKYYGTEEKVTRLPNVEIKTPLQINKKKNFFPGKPILND